MIKRFLVKKVYANGKKTVMLATNDAQKAIDEFLWCDYCSEVDVFDEQGNHIRTVSQLRDIAFIK